MSIERRFYLRLPKKSGFRSFEDLAPEEIATIALRCPYCGTDKSEHTDLCPVSQIAKVLEDAEMALWELRKEIEPMAKQIICPADNTFTRQLATIDKALNPILVLNK